LTHPDRVKVSRYLWAKEAKCVTRKKLCGSLSPKRHTHLRSADCFRQLPRCEGRAAISIRSCGGTADMVRRALNRRLPVEQPIKFDLVVNLKTTKTLGVGVPLSIQQRTDEVIE
jgi:hypothetical protein